MQLLQDNIQFTPLAVEQLKKFLAEDEKGKGLRIFLDNGQYALALDHPEAEDHIVEYPDFKLLVDEKSLKYVVGLKVDYVEDEHGPAFELSNSFSKDGGCHEGKGTCGCSKGK